MNRKYVRAEEGKPPGISVVYYDSNGRPVFPDYETGKQSMRLLLKEDFYQRLTLNQLPKKYTGVLIDSPDTGK